jgi:competence protein ComEC
MRRVFIALGVLLSWALASPAADSLEVYFIDVEGGQATLFVSPSGESMLVDTGWGENNNRDADRIVAAAMAANVKKIDYLFITHFHADHVGGVPQLAAKLPIGTFLDPGPRTAKSPAAVALFNVYAAVRDKGRHFEAKPGDAIPVRGLDVRILQAAGVSIESALPGAGQANPECAAFQPQKLDPSENAQSGGLVVQYGNFRLLDLGDLTWNKEKDLICPVNKIGRVDVLLLAHHGLNSSNSPQLVHAVHPRVAIMNNGPRKGASAESWQTIHASPGFEDLWQVHFAEALDKEHNAAQPFIANSAADGDGNWIKLTAQKNGTFTVVNGRNNYKKTYKK